MMNKLKLITQTRRDLFDLSETLILGIEPRFLRDPKTPVIFRVEGTFKSGKKIVTDAGRSALFRDAARRPAFSGNRGFDEYWKGKVGRARLEVQYMDGARGSGYSIKGTDNVHPVELESAFFAQRRHGGVTFVQNSRFNHPEFKKPRPDPRKLTRSVNIWIEDSDANSVYWCASLKGSLPRAFNDAVDQSYYNSTYGWVRYVQIEVCDPLLCKSRRFQQAIAGLSNGAREVKALLRKANADGVMKRPACFRPYRRKAVA